MHTALFAIVRTGATDVDDGDVARLSAALAMYGDHEHLVRPGPGIVLGRRSAAPIDDDDDRPVLFDGRLDAPGPTAPAVAAAVDRLGARAFTSLDGDGAFIHVDPASRRLLAAVDHVTTSPLFWANPEPGVVVVATEAAALPGVCGTSNEVDEAFLVDAIAGLRSNPEATERRAVRAVPAGHVLVVDGGAPRLERWWRFDARAARWREADAVKTLRDAIADAVDRRVADVGPPAVELSGGLDSSAITALVARNPKVAGRTLLAYTYGPVAEPGWSFFDELPFARAVLDQVEGPVRHEVIDADDLGRRAIGGRDDERGFTATSQRRARDAGAKVLLSGWGGDHIVTDHAGPALPGMFLAGAWRPLWRDLRAGDGTTRRSPARTLASFGRLGARSLRAAATARFPVFARPGDDEKHYLTRCCLRPETVRRFDVWHRLTLPGRTDIDLAERRRHALDSGVLGARIATERRNAARAGVEMRYPLLDRRLIELAATIPDELWHRDGTPRWLFRMAMQGVLPETVRWRKDKLGGTSDGVLWIARGRDELIARAKAVRDDPVATALVDVDALSAQLEAIPDEHVLREQPDHGVGHPSVHRRGALLRALATAELLSKGAGDR